MSYQPRRRAPMPDGGLIGDHHPRAYTGRRIAHGHLPTANRPRATADGPPPGTDRMPVTAMRILATANRLLLPALLLTAPAAPSVAQAPPRTEPELYLRAEAQLAEGDTVAALSSLRRLTGERPDFARGWGLLGRLLTDRAGAVMTEYHERLEADHALRRAWKLEPRNPLWLIALADLMRKQWMLTDSRRVLARAQRYLDEHPEDVAPEDRAALWYLLGLNYEDIYLDTRDLVFVPDLPINTPECAAIGTFCLNFSEPKEFNAHFRTATSLSEEADDDYARMTLAFRRVLDADRTHEGAFRRLAIHLVERGERGEAQALARRFVEQVPDSPWGHLTLGLIYQRAGLDSLAQASFDAGIDRADPRVALHYRDVSSLLREGQAEKYRGAAEQARDWLEEILWRKSDPLYLTPSNEVRIAHLARVTFADLYFEDPSGDLWGAETERGQVYVRYGPPERIWQIPRDASREMGASAFDVSTASAHGGGRWIFWNYSWDLPNFIFEKQLRMRHASHLISSASRAFEEDARAAAPAIYATSFELVDYPGYVARFRGKSDSIVDVDLYTEIPAHRATVARDSIELGLFLFAGPSETEIFRRNGKAPSSAEPRALTYTIPLLPGSYRYSLEARLSDQRAAVRRGEIEVSPFLPDQPALSDLVLAHSVSPLNEEPTGRRDFAIRVNHTSVYDPDLPMAVYWEVYGLTPQGSFANYRVRLTITDAQGKTMLARVTDALGLGGEDEIELAFERLVEWDGDRVPEYLTLQLANSEPGDYRVRIDVEDLVSGRRVAAERTFTIGTPR